MTSKHARRLAAALTLVLAATACERDLTDLDPASFPSASAVFIDEFAPGLDFASFSPADGAKVDALSIDENVFYSGSAALRFDIPAVGDPTGAFAGGVFFTGSGRDLTSANVLTFWARASRAAVLNEVGFGDDLGESRYRVAVTGLPLYTSWQQYAIPIPDPSVLTQERGLFWISDGTDDTDAYTLWIDEVKFENLPSVGAPQAEIFTRTVPMAVGDVVQPEVTLRVPVGGTVQPLAASPAYYGWSSSDPSVATVSDFGLITKVADGSAEITATLGGDPVPGSVTVETGDGIAGVVFDDAFGAGVGFASFGDNAKVDAVEVDATESFRGSRSIRVTVPGQGDPSGFFAGGVFRTGPTDRRDLTGFDALVFWAKAAKPTSLDVVGFGNDNTGASRFPVQTGGLSLSTEWQRFVVPIPDPARLDAVRGLFTFAEGTEDGAQNTIWFDEIAFVEVDDLGPPQPTLAGGTVRLAVGETYQVGFGVSFALGGETLTVNPDARYFDWNSSDAAVATVSESGVVTMAAEGSADITATLAGVPAAGVVTVQTGAPTVPPDAPAPDPTQDAASVISIYSDSYASVGNEGFNRYGAAGFEEVDVAGSGNRALRYTLESVQNGNFQIIELGGANIIDAAGAGMTNFRFDVWVPGDVAGSEFVVGLVNIDPANPPATRGDVRVSARSTPPIAQGQWLSFDVPLADLTGLNGTSHIQQVVIDLVNTGEIYLDNLYFYAGGGGGGGAPATPAPDPTQDAASVISIYSDSYTDVGNEGFNRYGAAGFEVVDVAGSGNSALRYTFVEVQNGNFQIIELGGANVIDAAAAGMTHFRFDAYVPTLDAGNEFVVGLVNIDPGNPPATRGDVRASAGSTPPIAEGQWLSFDVPLADLTNLNGTSHIQQVVIDLVNTGEVYLDNLYFYDAGAAGGGGGAPATPAPDPTQDAASVISIYSDSYTDVGNEGFNRYGAAGFEEVDVAGSGNSALRYTFVEVQNGNFQIIELGGGNIIDAAAAGMTHFRFDVYVPTLDEGNEFVVGLVNIDPGNPPATRGDVRASAGSTPPIAEGQWLSFDVPLADLTGLNGITHIQQLVVDLVNTGEIYLDNIYLYDGS